MLQECSIHLPPISQCYSRSRRPINQTKVENYFFSPTPSTPIHQATTAHSQRQNPQRPHPQNPNPHLQPDPSSWRSRVPRSSRTGRRACRLGSARSARRRARGLRDSSLSAAARGGDVGAAGGVGEVLSAGVGVGGGGVGVCCCGGEEGCIKRC